MPGKQYSDEFKLEVIKDYLTSELGVRRIAEKYNLPSKNYITKWMEYLKQKGLIENTQPLKKKTSASELVEKNSVKKTEYEKQLEKENLELRAKLDFFKEIEKIIESEKHNKKKDT